MRRSCSRPTARKVSTAPAADGAQAVPRLPARDALRLFQPRSAARLAGGRTARRPQPADQRPADAAAPCALRGEPIRPQASGAALARWGLAAASPECGVRHSAPDVIASSTCAPRVTPEVTAHTVSRSPQKGSGHRLTSIGQAARSTDGCFSPRALPESQRVNHSARSLLISLTPTPPSSHSPPPALTWQAAQRQGRPCRGIQPARQVPRAAHQRALWHAFPSRWLRRSRKQPTDQGRALLTRHPRPCTVPRTAACIALPPSAERAVMGAYAGRALLPRRQLAGLPLAPTARVRDVLSHDGGRPQQRSQRRLQREGAPFTPPSPSHLPRRSHLPHRSQRVLHVSVYTLLMQTPLIHRCTASRRSQTTRSCACL